MLALSFHLNHLIFRHKPVSVTCPGQPPVPVSNIPSKNANAFKMPSLLLSLLQLVIRGKRSAGLRVEREGPSDGTRAAAALGPGRAIRAGVDTHQLDN